jgi:hypothetical protein
MDRFLIAPCPDRNHRAGVWKIAPYLEPRIAGHTDLAALAGQPIIPPSDKEFYPAFASLRWREERLVAQH